METSEGKLHMGPFQVHFPVGASMISLSCLAPYSREQLPQAPPGCPTQFSLLPSGGPFPLDHDLIPQILADLASPQNILLLGLHKATSRLRNDKDR